ncbi:MAG: type IV pilus modification PilV family protein [Bacillota bacterium]
MKALSIVKKLPVKTITNKKGITLIELIVSLCIFVIVAAPFLATFLSSTRNNALSQEVLKSSTLAQKVMEEIKSRPLFLSAEAVTEAQAPLTDYREYLAYGNYKVKYKIIKEEGVVSSLSQTYEFEKLNDIVFDIEYTVDAGKVFLRGIPYDLNFNFSPVVFTLKINEISGVYSFEFYDENNPSLQSGSINTITGTEPVKVKIHYLNNSEDVFILNVNLDGIKENRDVCFYITDDKKDALVLSNTGVKPFYQFDELNSLYVEYFNVLYKIEVVVEKDSTVINKLVSYVKKIR